jgi:hypothetical protein
MAQLRAMAGAGERYGLTGPLVRTRCSPGRVSKAGLKETTVNPLVLAIMAGLLAAWIGIGAVVIAYGTPLGVAFYVLAVILTNPRVWRLQ